MKKLTLILLVLISSFSAFCSGLPEDQQKFVGTWWDGTSMAGKKLFVEKDKSFLIIDEFTNTEYSGVWEVKNDVLVLKFADNEEISFSYKHVDEKELEFSFSEGLRSENCGPDAGYCFFKLK